MSKTSIKLDPQTPLIWEVWNMDKKVYLEAIHTPQTMQEPARFFYTNFCEFFSRTPWYYIPIVWLPVVAFLLATCTAGLSVAKVSGLFVFGAFLWTITEYGLHRWLFHLDEYLPNHPVAILTHFLLHGVHHIVPMDPYRLVFPPVMAIPLSLVVRSVLGAAFFNLPNNQVNLIFAGVIFGYLCYDMMHYYTHHGRCPRDSYIGVMKAYHMKHHYLNPHLGYGITSKFWDHVFGTVLTWQVTKRDE